MLGCADGTALVVAGDDETKSNDHRAHACNRKNMHKIYAVRALVHQQ